MWYPEHIDRSFISERSKRLIFVSFRTFTNGTFNRVATSNTVTVGSFTPVPVASGISNPTAMAFRPMADFGLPANQGQGSGARDENDSLLPTPLSG